MYRYSDEMSPPHSSDRRPILPPHGSSSSNTGAGSSSRSRIRAPVSPPPIHSHSHSGGSSSAHVPQSRSRYRDVDPHRDDYPPPPSKHSDRYRDYDHDMHPPPPVSSSHTQHRYLPYKILCVANLNSKVSDGNIRDALIREFTRFGDVSVKVTHDANERFAYIYFRCYEDAREARHAKSRMILFDKLVEIDPIYERYPPVIPSSSSSSSSRRRSLTPDYPPPSSGYYSSSRRPVSPGVGYHYSSSSSSSSRRYPHPPPPASSSSSSRVMIDRYGVPYMTHRPDYPRDHPSHGHHSSSRDDYPIRSSGSSSNHHISSNSSTSLTGGSSAAGNNGNSSNNNNGSVRDAGSSSRDAKSQRESKKEKFPNYLHHIPPEEDDKATRTLFVGNLEVTISEPELKRIFERYGVVEDIDVKRPQPGSGNAYAFIKYQNLDMAHRSKVEMSGQYIGKFQCKIGYGKATPTTRIWVGGLGPWTSLSALEREFDRFGAIRKIDFIRGENHAYISYDSIDAAQAACQEMRGFPLGGPGKRLRVDFADPGPFSCDGTSPGSGVTSDAAATATTRVVAPGEKFPDADADLSREDVKEEEDADVLSGRNGQSSSWSDEERKRKTRGLESPSDGVPSPKRLRDDEPSVRKSSEELPEEGLRSVLAPESAANLSDLIDCCPSTWNGTLILKNSAFLTNMLHVSGDLRLVDSLMRTTISPTAPGEHSGTQRSTSSPQNQASTPEPSVAGSSVDERPTATTAASSSPSSAPSPSGGVSSETTGSEPTPVLRITQRLRLDPPKLDDVCRRMSAAGSQGHCMLLAIRAAVNCPQIGSNGKIIGDDATGEHEVVQRPFKNLVNYLKQKQAAGVIPLSSYSLTSASTASTTSADAGREMRGSLYAFPPCLFATELIQKVAPNFEDFDHKNEYLLVVVIRESSK